MLSLLNICDLENIKKRNQYPKEYPFEIFPEDEFQTPTSQLAIDQLSRIYQILTEKQFHLTIPVILGNSVLLDMLQDYFNQCASHNNQGDICKSLISVNGCSSEVSIHRSKLIIIIIHKDYFEKEVMIPSQLQQKIDFY
jgi:hypothetical protein